MPSANVKPEKVPGAETPDPLRQAITIVEHKIRNLEKRKGKLDSYKEIKQSGKSWTREQAEAVSKYDEVLQQLELSKEYVKQFSTIGDTSDKARKKQAKRENLERTTADTFKIKQVLIIQDVLQNMGAETVRDDFLAGVNGAPTITDTDLQSLDDLYAEVFPKHEGTVPFATQLQKSAEHLMTIIESRPRELAGSTGAKLQALITTIHTSGYFDQPEPAVVEAVPEADPEGRDEVQGEPVMAEEAVRSPAAEEVPLPVQQQPIPNIPAAAPMMSMLQNIVPVSQVESNIFNAQGFQPPGNSLPPTSATAADVMSRVGGNLTFFQDSQIDGNDVVPQPGGIPSGIPSRTFTNQTLNGQPAVPGMVYPQPTQNNGYVYNVPGMYPQDLMTAYPASNGTIPTMPSQRPAPGTEPNRPYPQQQPQHLSNGFAGPPAVPMSGVAAQSAMPVTAVATPLQVPPTQTYQIPAEPTPEEPTRPIDNVVTEPPVITDWSADNRLDWGADVDEWNPAGTQSKKTGTGKPRGDRGDRGDRPRNYNRSGNRNGYSNRSGGGGGDGARNSGNNYYSNSNGYRDKEGGSRSDREREFQPRDREFQFQPRGDRGQPRNDRDYNRDNRNDRDHQRGDRDHNNRNDRDYNRDNRNDRDQNRDSRNDRDQNRETRNDRDQNRENRNDRDQNRDGRDQNRENRDQNRESRNDRDQNRENRNDRDQNRDRGSGDRDFNGYGNYKKSGPPRGARADRGERGDRPQGNGGPRNNSRAPRNNPRPQASSTYRQEAQ